MRNFLSPHLRLLIFEGFHFRCISPWPKAKMLPLPLQHFQMLVSIKTGLISTFFPCETLINYINLASHNKM